MCISGFGHLVGPSGNHLSGAGYVGVQSLFWSQMLTKICFHTGLRRAEHLTAQTHIWWDANRIGIKYHNLIGLLDGIIGYDYLMVFCSPQL